MGVCWARLWAKSFSQILLSQETRSIHIYIIYMGRLTTISFPSGVTFFPFVPGIGSRCTSSATTSEKISEALYTTNADNGISRVHTFAPVTPSRTTQRVTWDASLRWLLSPWCSLVSHCLCEFMAFERQCSSTKFVVHTTAYRRCRQLRMSWFMANRIRTHRSLFLLDVLF